MRFLLVGLAVLFAGLGEARAEVRACSGADAAGVRMLCHEALIDAPVGEVWRLWATSEGLASWAAPVAAIELVAGGVFESSYELNGRIGAPGNIKNRIVAFTPERLLVLQVAEAPPGFPHGDAVRELTTVIELEPVGQQTRVRVSMFGYREGAAFDALYRHFDWGNAWSLGKLEERVTHGPIDWRVALAQGN